MRPAFAEFAEVASPRNTYAKYGMVHWNAVSGQLTKLLDTCIIEVQKVGGAAGKFPSL